MDQWRKVGELGRGGFGVVSLWEDTLSHKKNALKCCKPDVTPEAKENWRQEVDKMMKLDHPNIIKVEPVPKDLASLSSLPILCMEFCTGGDLRKELCKSENICGLPEETVRHVLRDVTEGIQYLHSVQIIHRDIKPENIVLHFLPGKTSPMIVYKLIDLGYAKEWDQSSLCHTLVGTLPYIAPELFHNIAYNRSVDYWSLGLVCYEIITGFRPFDIDAPVPEWLKLLKKKGKEDICLYETWDGERKYGSEIHPENHISLPLKHALEDWLKIALEWDGLKRGKNNNGLLIFSSLKSALDKKVVTVYCVSKLKKLSYEIYESTLAQTLKHWVKIDTDIPEADQLLLLPSGLEINDQDLLHSHYDNDPKLVAMLYLLSKSEGLKLPSVKGLQSKQPILVRRMLESSSDSLPYHILRRAWANSVYFIQSILDHYKAFIEAYSVKMLSLMQLNDNLSHLERQINFALPSLQASFDLSKQLLHVDLENINKFYIADSKIEEWKKIYIDLEREVERYGRDASKLVPSVGIRLNFIHQLQEFGDPGLSQIQKLSQLLTEARSLYCTLIKVPHSERSIRRDSRPMIDLIYQLWNIFSDIAFDQPLGEHLQELAKTEKKAKDLTEEMRKLEKNISFTQSQVTSIQLKRQANIWDEIKEKIENVYSVPPPLLPSTTRNTDRIRLHDWAIE